MKPKRTEIAHGGDFAPHVVPAHLDYPPEIEDATEAVRAAIARLNAAREASRIARKRHESAERADRLAAAQASAAGASFAPTEPALRRDLDAAHAAETAAIDAVTLAVSAQQRAITRPAAAAWRASNGDQLEAANENIRKAVAVLGDRIAARDELLLLDAALARVERGEHYRLDVAAPGYAQRKLAQETERVRDGMRRGLRPMQVPNEPRHLLAALTADADRWRIAQETKQHEDRTREIVLDVRALRLPAAKRVAEITRRLTAEGVPIPHNIGMLS